jgi:hypothetical protein
MGTRIVPECAISNQAIPAAKRVDKKKIVVTGKETVLG